MSMTKTKTQTNKKAEKHTHKHTETIPAGSSWFCSNILGLHDKEGSLGTRGHGVSILSLPLLCGSMEAGARKGKMLL